MGWQPTPGPTNTKWIGRALRQEKWKGTTGREGYWKPCPATDSEGVDMWRVSNDSASQEKQQITFNGPMQSGSGKSILHSIHMHMVYNEYSNCFTDQIPNSLQLSCKALLL